MKTYLVPIDFSAAAFNAANFAAELSKQTDVTHIILMNAYYITFYETMFPDPNMMMLREQEIEESAADRIRQLEQLRKKLLKRVRAGVQIHTHLNRSHLLRAVVDTGNKDKADVVILGSTGNSSGPGSGIGSHVIKVSKASPAPVIVVPQAYHYQQIDKAVIACDFKKVKDSVPLRVLHKLLGAQSIRLLVVNIDPEGRHEDADPELLAEESALHEMLKSFKPQYYYVNKPDIITGVLEFAEEHKAQVVIALPHTYSFLQSVLHSSISRQLAITSSVPVLLLK